MTEKSIISVKGDLYEYVGCDNGIHELVIIDIDDEGILTYTYETAYFTDAEMSDRGISLNKKQWLGLAEELIRENYDITEAEISEAAKNIVCYKFSTVEELKTYIDKYMRR